MDKGIDLWVIDAFAVATEVGMGNRINTVMQPCFFSLSGVLPADEAIARIKDSVKKTYAKRGDAVVQRNYAAIDAVARAHDPRDAGQGQGDGGPRVAHPGHGARRSSATSPRS